MQVRAHAPRSCAVSLEKAAAMQIGWTTGLLPVLVIPNHRRPMLTQHYFLILHLHIACVILSGALFFARGIMRMRESPLANHRVLRVSSYVIDTTLLAAAILLTLIIRQYPLTQGWLTAKVALLLVYVVLGSLALKRARTRRARLLTFLGALAVYGYIIGVAIAHHPLGVFRLIAGA
jgi:uncharacterized membrane protein SirB2